MSSDIIKTLLTKSCWHYHKINGNEFIIKILIEDKTSDPYYIVLLSDFISIWKEEVHSNDLLRRNTTLNPNVEIPVQRLLQHINQVVNSTKLQLKNRTENEIVLVSDHALLSVPYKWEFHLQECDKNAVADHLTIPLVIALAELNRRQQHLIRIINQKDSIIENCRAEGIAISHDGYEQQFQIAEFEEEMAKSMKSSDITSSKSVTFGREMEPIFELISENFFSCLNTNEQLSANPNEDKDLIEKRKSSSEEDDVDSSTVERLRRQELEEKLSREKLKKEAAKANKKLKL